MFSLCLWEHEFSIGPSHSPGSKCSGQKCIQSCTLGTDFGTRASREVAFTWEMEFLWGEKNKSIRKRFGLFAFPKSVSETSR